MAEFVHIDDGYSTSADTLDYRITYNGVEIERGRAYGRDFPIMVYLNRVASEFLKSSFPEGYDVVPDEGACGVFAVTDMNGVVLYQQTYVNGYEGTLGNGVLSEPINGHADPRMRIFYGAYKNSSSSVVINAV